MMNNVFTKTINLFALILTLILFLSCTTNSTNRSKNQADTASSNNAITENPDTAELSNFQVRKLAEDCYIVRPDDTLRIQKPFIKIYEGIIEGRNVQAIVEQHTEMEWLHYSIYCSIYIEGDDGIRFGTFYEIKKGIYRTNKEEKDAGEYECEYNGSELKVLHNGKSYILKEADLKVDAFDRFDMKTFHCTEYSKYKLSYSYDFSFKAKKIPPLYSKVFSSNEFLNLTLGKPHSDISKWKHYVSEKIETDKDTDEETACYNYSNHEYYSIMYADSAVFILKNLSHQYMGGAHGMYSTTYYNFDIKTGNIINLTDMVDIENEDYKTFFETKIKEVCEIDVSAYTEIDYTPSTFLLLPKGIYYIFPPYSLMGGFWEKEVFISYQELRPYMK